VECQLEPVAKDKKGGRGATGASILKDFGDGIVAKIGRYGAYLTNGKVNIAIPRGKSAETLTPEEAAELIKSKL
jgi:DNA topoisomerase-1